MQKVSSAAVVPIEATVTNRVASGTSSSSSKEELDLPSYRKADGLGPNERQAVRVINGGGPSSLEVTVATAIGPLLTTTMKDGPACGIAATEGRRVKAAARVGVSARGFKERRAASGHENEEKRGGATGPTPNDSTEEPP